MKSTGPRRAAQGCPRTGARRCSKNVTQKSPRSPGFDSIAVATRDLRVRIQNAAPRGSRSISRWPILCFQRELLGLGWIPAHQGNDGKRPPVWLPSFLRSLQPSRKQGSFPQKWGSGIHRLVRSRMRGAAGCSRNPHRSATIHALRNGVPVSAGGGRLT